MKPESIVIGIDRDGKPVEVTFIAEEILRLHDEVRERIVTASSGYGKSNLLRLFLFPDPEVTADEVP